MKSEDKKYLLDLARSSIEHFLNNKKKLSVSKPDSEDLNAERAVFVTLNIHDELRGCIGHMQPRFPLYRAVSEMAVEAAFGDPRFPSVSSNEELKNITIEISVLSPMQKIADYKQIRLGKDGVWIQKGIRSGVFLPQVAEDTGWDLETFLGNLCAHKAGLAYEEYKNPATDIFIFQVEKFSDNFHG
jgi:AmmeMemoRadiSam system protein A